jgi:hypothetical protein
VLPDHQSLLKIAQGDVSLRDTITKFISHEGFRAWEKGQNLRGEVQVDIMQPLRCSHLALLAARLLSRHHSGHVKPLELLPRDKLAVKLIGLL